MASKISASVAARTPDVVPKDERADMLHQFGECAAVVRNMLYDDRALDEEELVFIDKHFQILNMAYLRWKRKHRPTDEGRPVI